MSARQNFTTFVNVDIGPRTQAEFQRLEQLSGRTFNAVAEQAKKAARATAGIAGGSGTGGLAKPSNQAELTRIYEQQRKAADGAAKAINGQGMDKLKSEGIREQFRRPVGSILELLIRSGAAEKPRRVQITLRDLL